MGNILLLGRSTRVPQASDGAVISGGLLTVTRAAGGFGGKSPVAPLYWNDFESQNVGDSYLTCGMANLGNDGTSVVVANDRSFSGTKSLKCVYPPNPTQTASAFPRVGNNIPNSQSLYMWCRHYWTIVSGVIGDKFIFKHARAGFGTAYSGQPQFHVTRRYDPATGIQTGADAGYVVLGTSSYSQDTFGTVISPQNENTWSASEFVFKLASPGGIDGIYQALVNGKDNVQGPTVGMFDLNGNHLSGANGYCKNNDSAGNSIQWAISVFDGLDQYGINNTVAQWLDCAYVDITLQRCVMTDNSNYSASAKFMIQIPNGSYPYTDTGATFTYRNDGFTVGQSAWVHMFDVNGNEVVNYPVTVQ